MKTLKYLLATMLLLGVCNLTHSQKLSLGIFPEPQEVTISSQTYAPSHGYTLRGINNPDADAVKLLKEALPFAKSGKSLPLEIKKLKDKTPEMQRSGAYTLTITKKGITIGIVDDNSLFYAAQTLKQLAKYDEGKKILPLCSIKDYPDVLFRGTVEGFYGQPWSHADRIEQINPWLIQFEFLGKAGTSALHMAHAWYEKDRSYTWQRYLETSALLDSMKLINRTLNQKAQPKGVKVGSKVLHPFIVDLYRQTGRNLLSTDGIAPDEVKVSIPSIFTNIDQLKSQPCAEGDNTVGYVPLFEVVKVQPNQYLGIGWEIQKEAESFCFNLPKSNQPGRVFEWSADGKSWSLIPHVSTENAKDTIRTIDPKARYIRMRNNSDQQMELYVLGFTATTKQDPQINEALMMYDMNLDTYKNLNPGEMIHIKCDDINAVSFFLSGSNENLVSITGLSQDGEKNIVYQGNVGYIKLNKTMFEDFSSLEITTIGKESIHIHQIVRE